MAGEDGGESRGAGCRRLDAEPPGSARQGRVSDEVAGTEPARAQGQATISTATPARMPLLGSPASHQPPKVSSARAATTGTNTEAIRSARRWIGAFEPCAS